MKHLIILCILCPLLASAQFMTPGDPTFGQVVNPPMTIGVQTPFLQYVMNEGSGSSLADTGTGNNAGTMSSPAWTTMGSSPAVTVNGGSGYIIGGGDTSTFNFIQNTKTFTIRIWMRVDTSVSQYGTIIMTDPGAGGNAGFWFAYQQSSGSIVFYVVNNGGSTMVGKQWSSVVPDSNPHCYTITSDGSTVTLYVDGVANGTTASITGTSTGNSASVLWYGHDGVGDPLAANLRQSAIWTSCLTPTQVGSDYTATIP
jgi:hypothetical protein